MKKPVVIILLSILSTTFAVSPSLTSFNGGQVSPLLEARTDFPKYLSSSRTMENMLVTVQGPVERRPGTKFIASQRTSSATGRIVAFERSADESFILLFEDQFLRFFTNGGQVLDSVGTEDISGLDNQVAQWKLNETDGTAVDDAVASVPHDGTASVDIETIATAGKVGTGSFDLDGQYNVTVPSNAALSFDDSGSNPFSIVGWGFVTQQDDLQNILSKWDESTGSVVNEWRLSLSNDRKLQLHLSDVSANLSGDRVAQWFLNDTDADQVVDDNVGAHVGALTPSNCNDITTTGKINTCFDFGGSEAVEVADNAALSFGNGTVDSPFSIAVWVFVTNTAIDQVVLSKWSKNSKKEWRLQLSNAEKIQLHLSDQSAGTNINRTADDTLTTGWHLVVATYAGQSTTGSTAANFITIYIDGTEVNSTASNNAAYDAMEDKGAGVAIGASYDVTDTLEKFAADKIDNVVLFDIELTAGDVLGLWNSGEGKEAMAEEVVSAVSDDAIPTGWHFFGATYDSTGGATAADGIILYVNGAAVESTNTNNASYTAMQAGAALVRIGAQEGKGGNATKFWGDKIDEISLFSDVLTPAEVASLHSTTPYEIATPYLTADLSSLAFTKNDDIMYIAHPDYKPRQLTSTRPALWALEEIDFQTGPFLGENDTATTIALDGVTGSVTLTASTSIFKGSEGASHVGSIWQLNQVGGNPAITDTFTDNGISISTNNFIGGYSFTTTDTNWQGTITLQRSTNDGISWRPALTPLTDTNFDNPGEIEEDGAMYRVVASNYVAGSLTFSLTVHDETNRGVVRITGVESGTSATATVLNNIVSTSATTQWREGYWSDFRGWPKAVTVHQQRLVFGGSVSFPQTIWFGRQDPDEYENFLEGTLDTSAFTVELEGQNPVRWLLSQDYMFIGTSGTIGKWGEQGQAVTPTSPNYQEQTRHGSAAIQAGLGGDAVLYIERGLRKVRQFSFDLQVDKYLSPDLTILSPEITESGIVEIAFQLRPDPILWCVLGNGDMATLTYQQDQSIAAWTKQITDGDFKSVAVIPGQTGTNEDEVWVIAEREINSNTVVYIEQFQPRIWGSDPNDVWMVDSGISYDGTATDTFTGADHLEAETLSIYADRLIESPEVVVSGGFTIDNAASRVLVGMPYTSKLETLPLVIDPQDRAANKKVRKVSFDVYRTGAFQYGNGANSILETVRFKNDLDFDNTATSQDLDVDPATSIIKPLSVAWVYGSTKKQTIYLESDEPMPLTIRAITTDYKFYSN